MSRRVTVKTVELVDHIEMRKADCVGETRLVPHVPSSSRAGKQLLLLNFVIVITITIVIIIIIMMTATCRCLQFHITSRFLNVLCLCLCW